MAWGVLATEPAQRGVWSSRKRDKERRKVGVG